MVRRRKVVHVVVAGDIGGAERLLVDLTLRPEESGADHCVALMTPNPALRDMIISAGVRVRDRGPVRSDPLAYLWRAFGPRDVGWLERVLTEEAATIVHVHTYASHILGIRAAMRQRLPVLRTEHGVHHYLDPSCSLYRSWALRHTDRVVAVSDYVRRFVAARVPFADPRLQVVRNGVDAGYFRPAPPSGEGPFTFAVVGRLEPWKQVDLVLRAMTRVPEIRLLVAGDGSVRRKLEALSTRLGLADRVTFFGYCRDPRPVFASCDAAINSSRDEPLGLSVLEAMAMQRPVVGFAAGGIPEIVRDRETGWLVRDGSVEALGVALAAASGSRGAAARLGAAARAFVERECQIEDMCRGYAQAYAALDDRAGDRRAVASDRQNLAPA